MTSEVPPASGQVLYRKWRPQTFAEVVGQEAVTRTLRNAVAAGKVAHAYLLCGPRGTGKTSLGRLVAKAVNCANPGQGEPCNRCDSCQAYLEGRAIDLVEMDAASNRGIDEIRRLKDRVGLAPMGGRYKVYLVDEVHMLTQEAYNALLKTLEEPPPHVIFVLATTEAHRVPATIISRCQRFDLKRIPLAAVVERLAFLCQKEGLTLDPVSLQEVARSASGSLRDAINILEQLTAYYGPAPSLEQIREMLGLSTDSRSRDLARSILARNLTQGLRVIAAARDDGLDMRQFSRQVITYLRWLLLVKSGASDTLDLSQEQLAEMESLASSVETGAIVQALRAFAQVDFREDPQSSLPLELALVEFIAAASESIEEPALPTPTQAEDPSPGNPTPETEALNSIPATSATLQEPITNLGDAPKSDDFLEQLRLACRQVDKQIGALLNGSCEILALEEDAIVLGVYFGFHLEKLEAPSNRRIIEEAASRLQGRSVVLKCQRLEPPPAMKARSGHLVQVAQELGARPVAGLPAGEAGQKGGEDGRARED